MINLILEWFQDLFHVMIRFLIVIHHVWFSILDIGQEEQHVPPIFYLIYSHMYSIWFTFLSNPQILLQLRFFFSSFFNFLC